MSYWQQVQYAAGMSGRYHWVVLGLILSTFFLGAVAPLARRRLRATVLIFLASVLSMLVCGWLLYACVLDESAAGYRYIHFASQLLLAIGVINLVSVLLFRVL